MTRSGIKATGMVCFHTKGIGKWGNYRIRWVGKDGNATLYQSVSTIVLGDSCFTYESPLFG